MSGFDSSDEKRYPSQTTGTYRAKSAGRPKHRVTRNRFLGQKRKTQLASAVVAILVVMMQQIHSANATSRDDKGNNNATYAALDGNTGNCTGRNAFDHIDVWNNGNRITDSTGTNQGDPFAGWQNSIHQGDHLKVWYAVAPGCGQMPVTLSSYRADEPLYHAGDARQAGQASQAGQAARQILDNWDTKTGYDDGKMRSVSVTVPSCYFRINFANRDVVRDLSSDNYDNGSLVGAAAGGTQSCTPNDYSQPNTIPDGNSTPGPNSNRVGNNDPRPDYSVASEPARADALPACPEKLSDRIADYTVDVEHPGDPMFNGDGLSNNVKSSSVVTVHFRVLPSCNMRFTLASYQAHSTSTADTDLRAQTLYRYATQQFGPGLHWLKVSVPACYFQVDFVAGSVIKNLANGSPDSIYGDRLIDTATGGQACDVAQPVEQTQPAEQTRVAEKTVVQESVSQPAPAVTPAPVTTPVVYQQPTQLAKTGIDLFPMFATGTISTIIGFLFLGSAALRRRNSYWDVY